MVHVLKCKLIKKYFWFFILTFIDIVGMASVFDHIMSIHERFGQKGFLCFSYKTINPIACQNFQFPVIQRTKEPHCILWYTAFDNRVKLFFPRLTFIKMYDIKTGQSEINITTRRSVLVFICHYYLETSEQRTFDELDKRHMECHDCEVFGCCL